MDDDFKDINDKNHLGTILGIIFIVLLVGVIGFGYYYKNKPEVIFSMVASKTSKLVSNELTAKLNNTDLDISFIVDAGKEYKEITDLVNNLLLKVNTTTNLENSELSFNFKADYKNKEIVSIDGYYINKMIYLKLNDLFDKVITSKVETEDIDIKIDSDDVNTILEELVNAYKVALKEGKYSSSKTTLDGVSVTKNVFTIDNSNIEKVDKAYFDYLKNSDKFMNTLSKITKEDKKELVKSIENIKPDKMEKPMNVCIYTKGFKNELVKSSIEEDKKEIMSISIPSKNEYKFQFKEDTQSLDCKIKDLGNEKYTSTCDMEVDGIKVGYTINMSRKSNVKINKIDASNAISYEDLKEEDLSKIMENLSNKEGVKDFMNAISSLMGADENKEM